MRGAHALLHPGKAAETDAGVLGELHPSLLDGAWGAFELDLATLFESAPERIVYEDVLTHPAVLQDIAVTVDEDVEAGALVDAAREAAGALLREARVFDVYRGEQVGDWPEVGCDPSLVPVARAHADRGRGDGDPGARRGGARGALRRRAPHVTNPTSRSVRRRGTVTRPAVVAVALAAAALFTAAGGGAAPAQNAKLSGIVGPGFTISLRDASGARVTRLDPGTYEIEISDMSVEHNFRLTGPGGVNQATEIGDTGMVTWTVTLVDGAYRYVCDPHAPMMNGSFTVGTPRTTTPPPPSAITPSTRLRLTSGPGYSIRLTTAAGKAVKTMKTGTYTVQVRDRSRIHNAHAIGPGYNRKTTPLTYVGTQTWRVKLARAGTLRFVCDPHAAMGMRGSAKIVR